MKTTLDGQAEAIRGVRLFVSNLIAKRLDIQAISEELASDQQSPATDKSK